MASVIILIGVPASGKSSLAEKMMRASNQNNQIQTKLISPDRIRASLYGSAATQGDWAEIWEQIQQEFTNAAKSQQSVIYDATNYKREYRKNIIYLAKENGFKPITGIWLNVPLWICLSRNETRDRVVPDDIVVDMYRTLSYTPPTLSEGFDRILFRDEKLDNEWID
ncbi:MULTISPECIES: AAA family ATPase [Pseudanabaena]|uniref:6-phosphofructo-2-kinase n=2 Tax=Pseudanabaena TaxID=1152 RepID=L8N1B4_9CYAN|nr:MULTISPECIES: AAA family ATPase [Pseudanabaena]ELS34002.1 6-phosphofructo-2-kinase [Pseudanabaena biceps PCC 7429]MDG3493788.1 AAA family ATPase [Pseudanabaena catenata USMAC16]